MFMEILSKSKSKKRNHDSSLFIFKYNSLVRHRSYRLVTYRTFRLQGSLISDPVCRIRRRLPGMDRRNDLRYECGK